MNPTDPNNIPPECMEDEINLLDLLLVLLKRKWLIFWITLIAIVFSVCYSLYLPEKFTATARILPPQQQKSGISSFLSQAGGAFGGLASGLLGGGQSSSDVYVGIMKSRSVADVLINKFDLKKLWEAEYISPVYNKLSEITKINVSKDTGIISVSVEEEDPKRAAAMANIYVEALDQINRTVLVTEGQRKRVFLEERLEKAKKDLINAETGLQAFQEKYNLVSINEQAKASIEGAATLKGEIIAAQTEFEVLKKFGTEKQNEAIMLKSKIEELRKQLAKIESGNPEKNADNFYIPFKELPDLGMRLARLMREAKIQEQVFELLTSQYEMAKIEEAKDMNTIQVLDKAVPPDTRSAPKKKMIVILSTVVGFFTAIFLAFIKEFVFKVKTQDPDRYNELVKGVKFWRRS